MDDSPTQEAPHNAALTAIPDRHVLGPWNPSLRSRVLVALRRISQPIAYLVVINSSVPGNYLLLQVLRLCQETQMTSLFLASANDFGKKHSVRKQLQLSTNP